MQKKTLDEHINLPNYNKNLFTSAMKMISNTKQISTKDLQHHFQHPSIKQKYSKLQSSLSKMLKTMGKFTQAEKPSPYNPMGYAIEIFDETKILIETQIKKIKEESNTIKRTKQQEKKIEKRPQDIYQGMKVQRNFDRHAHHKCLENNLIPRLRRCEGIIPSQKVQPERLVYVQTVAGLNSLVQQLKTVQEIAVDVQHSSRSYEGLVCLIQISTRFKDYIIDVFPLWASIDKLAEVIGNPNILKVMHGAQMDTKWLQRDFNLHIVNLFDTHKAARYLGLTTLSYGYLLQHFCGVNTDKSYQRADWRVRPLSPEMIHYARTDTHYLLEIFDKMRIEMQKQSESLNLSVENVFVEIQKSSHDVTLIEAELFSYQGKEIYQKLNKEMDKDKFIIIDRFFFLLNKVAYENDECFEYLASNRLINESFAFIKDLLFNKNSKVTKRVRIDKIISILMKSESPFINYSLTPIKETLEQFFIENQSTEKINKTPLKERPNIRKIPFIEVIDEGIQQFTRSQNSVQFQQYQHKSFEEVTIVKPLTTFKPITVFLSDKFNIQRKNEMEDENVMIEEEDEEEGEESEEKNEEEDNGVIEFKRMKQHVIYTVEDAEDEGFKTMLPRKKRKELEYEKRLKNKVGNIYDLLEDD